MVKLTVEFGATAAVGAPLMKQFNWPGGAAPHVMVTLPPASTVTEHESGKLRFFP
jgi:hypothetical protein